MKIAIVCPYNFFIPGGVQEHVRAQAEELIKRGHKVVIITPRPRDYKEVAPAGVVFIGSSTRIRTPQNTSNDISAADSEKIEKLFNHHAFDIIHIHEPAIPLLGRQIIAKANCPVVGTFHAAPPGNTVGKSIMSSVTPYIRNLAKKLDEITVVSPAAAEFIGKNFNYRTISNGVDLNKYKPLGLPRNSESVLFVGRLEKRKGVKHLLEAFRVLQRKYPNASLDIAGDGPLRQSLEEWTTEYGLKKVKFHGFVSDDKKRELMASCGVFTSPALYGESFGIVLIEAMAMGAVVVGGDNPGYATVMTGRGVLSLVDPTDIMAYAKRLELFLKDGEMIELWRKWAHQTLKQYDWPRIIDKYELLYKELLN